MTGYAIGEVAKRTGFAPSTLRYYEDVGLVPPAARTEAGYRRYDDAAVERLAFIARAKQLGCSLEEIAALTAAWDGQDCGPVQDRLRDLIDAKLVDARARIDELHAFTAQLHAAGAALGVHTASGPCDGACGCTGHDVGAERVPAACTLDPAALPGRLHEWRSLAAQAQSRTARPGGVRLDFGPDGPVADLARLAAAERGCCGFFAFAVTVDERGVGLEVSAPPEALDTVAALFA
jgi:DNA-binding transcriptional MerR regulator